MNCKIRKWKLTDAKDIAVALSNKKIQDNLRDGLPYPYSEQDGIDFISSMLSANEDETFDGGVAPSRDCRHWNRGISGCISGGLGAEGRRLVL